VESLEQTVVASHISRKTSEMWGTQDLFPFPVLRTKGSVFPSHFFDRKGCVFPSHFLGREGSVPSFCPFHIAWVPHISLVFREMWDTTNVSRGQSFKTA
jgi:hypothetical protein